MTGLADRDQEAAGGSIEDEASVLPGRALAQTREALHVPPHRTRIRLERLRRRVRLAGVLLRHLQSLHRRVDHCLTSRPEFLGLRPQEYEAIVGDVGIYGGAFSLTG